MKNLNLHLSLPVTILKEKGRFVAYTPALDLSTSGKSYKEVKARFDELVALFIEELIKQGTLEEVLKEQGWTKVQKKWQSPVVVGQEMVTIPA